MNDGDLMVRLSEPFHPDEVKFKPQVVSGNRAMCIAYVDARVVMDRLDDVFGIGGWQTAYQIVPDGVVCKLRVKVNEWIEHHDVGSFSEQPDDGDKLKAAFSDSLKRAAVHLGIGRYLYRLPQSWVDYDPTKKKIVKPPQLPAWATPKAQATAKTPAATPKTEPPAKTPAQSPLPQATPELVREFLLQCQEAGIPEDKARAGCRAKYKRDLENLTATEMTERVAALTAWVNAERAKAS